MVQKINWTIQSRNDLAKIKEYISSDSPYQAERIIRLIYSSAQKLLSYPEIGKVIYTSEKFLVRRITVKSYWLIYVFHNEAISILSVHHQRRELEFNFDFTKL
jgi:addiction module RelE/StbE family toxin